MKYVIVIALVILMVWLWRNGRDRRSRESQEQRSQAAQHGKPRLEEPQDMVRCPVCSVHLPRVDALPGPGGQVYCCAEHSRQAGS
ncbi:MAG: PP0621 family protein [Pseudomonadota bacterium]